MYQKLWHTISNVCQDCLCFKALNKPKIPGFGCVKLPKSGKGEVWQGYTHPNTSQNLILDGDRAERRQLRNGLKKN